MTFSLSSDDEVASKHVLLAPTPSTMSKLLPRRRNSIATLAEGTTNRSSTIQQREPNAACLDSTLASKLLGDVFIAGAVTGTVAPALAVIDKALVQRANGSHTLLQSALSTTQYMIRHPIQYMKSPTLLWLWGTYACTYAAANSLRTLSDHHETTRLELETRAKTSTTANSSSFPSTASSGAAALFLGTTAVNMSTSIMKDRAYARMLGNHLQQAAATVTTPRVPLVSYAMWMSRDLTVVGSSFLLPSIVAPWIQEQTNLSREQALTVAQVASPVSAQLIAGPLHFVGLDWYNRPQSSVSLAERMRFLRSGLVEVVGARMLRFLPGYGLAGVWNRGFRKAWHERVVIHGGFSLPSVPQLMKQQPMLLESATKS